MKVIPDNFAATYGEHRLTGGARTDAALLRSVIGPDLRRLYAEIEAAPLPSSLAELAARLGARDDQTPGGP